MNKTLLKQSLLTAILFALGSVAPGCGAPEEDTGSLEQSEDPGSVKQDPSSVGHHSELQTLVLPASPLTLPGASSSPQAADVVEIRSLFNGKCLEILGFHNENGAKVGVWDCWGGANQKWYWNGSEIRNTMNNKCLELLGFHNENGAHVGMWDCWGGANQQWYWNGQELRNKMNNKCLDILGFNNSNGAQVGLWDCWGGANQHWR